MQCDNTSTVNKAVPNNCSTLKILLLWYSVVQQNLSNQITVLRSIVYTSQLDNPQLFSLHAK